MIASTSTCSGAPNAERVRHMSKHEILVDLTLSAEQRQRIELYETTQIIEMLTAEYELFLSTLKKGTHLPPVREAFDRIKSSIEHGEAVERLVEDILSLRNSIRNDIENVPVADATIDRRRRTIMRLFDMLDDRVRQLRARSRTSSGWIEYPLFSFRHSFELSFEVTSACGESPYLVRFDDSEGPDEAYRMILTVSAADEQAMSVPVRFCDTIRDLAENARKYSPPGSRIEVTISEETDALALSVKDPGIGIPEEEVSSVVGYGVRGSNAGTTPSNGGLGLTKAYSLVREWGGRMWIESSPAGTTIEARIPKP